MASNLVRFLSARPDSATFLMPSEIEHTVEELFARDALLPQPYKIFPADETQPAILGFPVAESAVLRDLDAKLDRWLADEVQWQIARNSAPAKEKAQQTMQAYLGQLGKVAENAMMANLLNDYHAIFWLAHSFDLAKEFSSVPRRVSLIDAQAGRTQGDALKYRIFSKWASETREQLNGVATRCAPVLDGEEQRALRFFRLLQDDVLILTDEFIGPDLRELRSFLTGYLHRDFQTFRDSFERLRTVVRDLAQNDPTFRAALPLLGAGPEATVTTALLLEPRFQTFLFDMPAVQNAVTREERESFQLIGRRVREFAVLN
ncbi:MAG TPA: hypothetical protein VG323_01470, partial [Thermoanaerobaculia bacterium]|nr:hypothetical protein [Thermoanaerobaculia bacterium]